MMAGNRVIFSASGVPNLPEIGSKPIVFFFSFFFLRVTRATKIVNFKSAVVRS